MTDPYLILELTTSCNLDCIFCYNVWKEHSPAPHKTLSLSDVKKIIPPILLSTGISGITLAGGEPLLNDEIFAITSFLSSFEIKVSITSNGSLLSKENIERFINCGIRHFEISLPAVDPVNFNLLCNSKDVKKVRSAMLNIKEQNAKFSTASVITKMNFEKITEIIELSAAFGADYFVFNRFVSGGEGRKNTGRLALSSAELIQALEFADKASLQNKIPVIVAIPVEHCIHVTSSFKNLRWGTCGCGNIKWVIDPEGYLRCCEQNPHKLGSLLTEDFITLKQKTEVKNFHNDNLKENCNKKDCFRICGGGCRYCR